MPVHREKGFMCAFSTERGEGESWIRAWDEHQAREIVRGLLRDEGVTGAVAVVVLGVDDEAGTPAPEKWLE